MKALEINDLSYHYAQGCDVLKHITLSVSPGEKVGVIGPNGAGKSTLFLHLNGILPEKKITTPRIHVFGTPVVTAELPTIRTNVGLLFQDPDDQLFCPTVWEDVAFGPSQLGLTAEEVNTRVSEALMNAGLTDLEQREPHRLSVGEKRRVCLAGILACHSKLLVLDEPTSNLDPRARRELTHLLKGLKDTQIIASHDLEFIVHTCSRVIVLDQGELVAEGPTTAILSDEKLMLAHGLETPYILKCRK